MKRLRCLPRVGLLSLGGNLPGGVLLLELLPSFQEEASILREEALALSRLQASLLAVQDPLLRPYRKELEVFQNYIQIFEKNFLTFLFRPQWKISDYLKNG